MNEAALRPVESFKAFAFKSVNVQFRISDLSCAPHCCCSLSTHFCGVLFSQQLSPIPLCRATNPLLSPLCLCTPCPADFASSFTFCSQVSRFVCGLMPISVTPLGERMSFLLHTLLVPVPTHIVSPSSCPLSCRQWCARGSHP